jgi:hypothetical protein
LGLATLIPGNQGWKMIGLDILEAMEIIRPKKIDEEPKFL